MAVVETKEELFEMVEVKTKRGELQVAREQLPLAQLTETANMLAKSTMVPVQYQNRAENCFIALDMASRMGVSFMVVMQNLYIIQGKPSWSGQAIASLLRSSPQFAKVSVHYVGTPNTDTWGAYITAIRNSTGETLKGATVSIAISKKEGWFQKSGSKWQTMPEIMLAYRAYAWFGRVHAPELMMGMQSSEELEDTVVQHQEIINPYVGVKGE